MSFDEKQRRQIERIFELWLKENDLDTDLVDIHELPLPELRRMADSLQLDVVRSLLATAKKYNLDALARNTFFDTALRDVNARRRLVSERIEQLSQQEQVEEFKDAVDAKVENPLVRRELVDLVAAFALRDQQTTDLEARAAADAEIAARAAELHRSEMRERKVRLWKSMLDREPVTVLIGSVLLVIMMVAVIVGMFSHTAVPEILSSAFLLILGFFFGQSASRRGGNDSD
ncbi:hypothetical protein ACWEKR_06030 [Nocardia sp. NPDC004573]